jgi:ABC-2 type transport system permease protein
MALNGQARAILWAQWRSLANMFPRANKGSTIAVAIGSFVWYGIWAMAAVAAASFLGDTTDKDRAYAFLSGGLLIALLYWQVIPVMMVSTGASLEIRKLRVYPVPHAQLFQLEVLLRFSTGIEMIILLSGLTVGLAWSPVLPLWPAVVFVPFLAFNLFLAAGVREVLVRFFSRKKTRELAVLAIALLAALPQFVVMSQSVHKLGMLVRSIPSLVWPWSATAHIVTGDLAWRNWAGVLAWTLLAFAFGRWMFERGLRFDEEAARSSSSTVATGRWRELLFRLPRYFLRDPVGVMVEKEFRTLFRSSAFRLLFLMGFTFGVLIWVPMRLRGSFTPDHYFVIVCAYAILLLSDALVWNYFGFDRSAVSFYLLSPVRIADVLAAKNIAALCFVLLELFIITVVCMAAGFLRSPQVVFDAYLVSLALLVYLMGIGNWSSFKYPKPVDPNQSWKRGNPGRFRFLLILIYPLIGAPFAFAYFARDAWEMEWVFYALVAVLAAVGAIVYALFLESALKFAAENKEHYLRELSQTETPITSILQG